MVACHWQTPEGPWRHLILDSQTDMTTASTPGQVTNLSDVNGSDITGIVSILQTGYGATGSDGVTLGWGGQQPYVDPQTGTVLDHSRAPMPAIPRATP
jgi:hypothetical protein